MNPLLIPALALLGALITDQATPSSESTLGRFPEYRDKTQAWLKAEYDRLEDERAGAGYGPKPTNWVPRSVSNPEIIERQTAIKALLGQQLWQRPYSVAKNMGIPERKHRELVAKAIARGDLVPESVFEAQAHNQADPGKRSNSTTMANIQIIDTIFVPCHLCHAQCGQPCRWSVQEGEFHGRRVRRAQSLSKERARDIEAWVKDFMDVHHAMAKGSLCTPSDGSNLCTICNDDGRFFRKL